MPEKTSSESEFFIKKSYKHRAKPDYFLDDADQKARVVHQPEVYEIGANLAERLGCTTIIDIGCGYAEKLANLHPKFNVIGIDYGKNIQYCENKFDFGKWIEADLESDNVIAIAKDLLENSAIICADVIEHLINPSHLLENLKKLLDDSSICIISTPERDLTRGEKHDGPPTNPHHVREWSFSEFKKFLESYNFKIGEMGLTQSVSNNNKKNTIIVVLKNYKVEKEFLKLKEINFKNTVFFDFP